MKRLALVIICAGIGLLAIGATTGLAEERPVPLDQGLELLVRNLVSGNKAIRMKQVAIADPEAVYGDFKRLAAFLADELTTKLARRGVPTLERRLLWAALDELKLNVTDLVDPRYAKSFGRLTGTELIGVGSVTELDEAVKLNIRLVNIETRQIVAAASVALVKDKQVMNLMGRAYPGRLVVSGTTEAQVFLNDQSIGTTGRKGQLRMDRVQPGPYTVRLEREGYQSAVTSIEIREDDEARVDLSLTKLPRPPSPGTAAFLSFMMPGLGDLYLGRSGWWLYPLAVGGSIYGAVSYSKKTDDMIWVTDDSGQRHLERRGSLPVYGFAALAGLIWFYDINSVYKGASSQRRIQAADGWEPTGWGFFAEGDKFLITYRFAWR